MKVIITGATGMIGSIILQKCFSSSQIKDVISLVRRSSGLSHEKLTEIVIDDFTSYAGHENLFENVDAVYFCLGVYTGQVTDAKFKEITVDYTIAFADMLARFSPDVRFCFLSGSGADRSEKSRLSFAKYKGMAENFLFDNLSNVFSFRPAYIYPVAKRKEPNLSYTIFRSIYPAFKRLGKNLSIQSTELAEAMFQTGLNGGGKRIFENKEIFSNSRSRFTAIKGRQDNERYNQDKYNT